ncbi:hypothetical protein ACFX11_015084 [Malus domestica]
MAGMLPGVESAQMRRVRQSGEPPCVDGIYGSTRRSCFCLYASNHKSHHTSTSPLQRSILNQAYMDEKLGVEAREANGRLDERLRTQRKSQLKRKSRKEESYRACKHCDQGSSAPPTPLSSAPAATRLAHNLTHSRSNYALIALIVLFLSLFYHPLSIIIFLIVFVAWLVLYFSRDQPLEVFGFAVPDQVVMVSCLGNGGGSGPHSRVAQRHGFECD